MTELDRIVSRHKELRGKHVHKIPQRILDLEAAYVELVSDYKSMCAGDENRRHCERVYRASRRIRRELLDYYHRYGLQLPEYLAGGAQTEQAGTSRYDVSSDAAALPQVGLSADSGRRKPRD